MTALLETWWTGLLAAPALLIAVAVAVLVSCAAAVPMLRRLPGIGWRAAWGVAALGALLAIVAFIAPPPQRMSSGTPVLVTEGAAAEALDSIPAGADVFVTGPAWHARDIATWIRGRAGSSIRGRTIRIASIDDVALYGAPPRVLHVVGDGLDAAVWRRARWHGGVEFTPPDVGAGFAAVDWPRRVDTGEVLVLDAAVTDATPAGARVILRDAQGAELAQGIAGGKLEAPALPAGRHLLRLDLENAGQVLERIDVAVRVSDPVPARVLLLAAAPSFEWRALGRWLAETDARVASRMRVSESRYRQRFDGMQAMTLSPLSLETLEGFDLVIIDGAALGGLAQPERRALLSGAHGAGVLVLLHDQADAAGLPDGLRALLPGDASSQSVYQVGASARHLPSGLTRLGLAFSGATGDALLSDLSGRPVIARARPGSAVALSLLRDSYRLTGAGAADEHARLWSRIVRSLARPAAPRDAQVAPAGARVGERIRVCVPKAAALPTLVLGDAGGTTTRLPLLTTPWRPAERCGWVWPAVSGWLEIRTADADPARLGAYWVAPAETYTTPRRLARIRATHAVASRATVAGVAAFAPSPVPRATLLPALLAMLVLAALIERLATARRRRALP